MYEPQPGNLVGPTTQTAQYELCDATISLYC